MFFTPAPGVRSFYFHVPFCARKCPYCAFYSEAPCAQDLMDRYVGALVRELRQSGPFAGVDTLYFGGGTPTLLSVTHWQMLLDALQPLERSAAYEWTVECNPAALGPEKAQLLRQGGVNRVSLGIQSLNESLLNRLGRIHNPDTARSAFEALRAQGFENINVDLIFAIPGQTLDVWAETLREVMALKPEHLSCYELTYEEDTLLFEQSSAGLVAEDEDLACAMYEVLLETADRNGFEQYEVSNFARRDAGPGGPVPRLACWHNVNYWQGGTFLGLGPSASSYSQGVRWQNCADTQRYCERLESGRSAVELVDKLTPLARAGEIAGFGLRLASGWAYDQFAQVTGFDLRQEWAREIAELLDRGWATDNGSRFRLTQTGLRFADAVARTFLKGDDGEDYARG